MSELLGNKADIICLQEVEAEHLRTLYRPKFAKKGYECLFKKKTGYKMDGCAIFYKTRLFQLLNHKGIEFNRTDLTSLLNRDNIGIIAVLKPKLPYRDENSKLVIANTHLIFNPRRSDVKLAQLKYFLSEVEEMSLESQDDDTNVCHHHPTILCGDLNSVPESEVKRFITKNESPKPETNISDRTRSQAHSDSQSNTIDSMESSDTSDQSPCPESSKCSGSPALEARDDILNHMNHSFKFKSVYPTQNKKGQPFISTFSSCIVDYIFYTPKLKLDSYKELLTEDELKEIGPIPNSEFPSDHLTLEAKFSM